MVRNQNMHTVLYQQNKFYSDFKNNKMYPRCDVDPIFIWYFKKKIIKKTHLYLEVKKNMIVFVFRIPVWEQTKQEMTKNIMLEECLVTYLLSVESDGYNLKKKLPDLLSKLSLPPIFWEKNYMKLLEHLS